METCGVLVHEALSKNGEPSILGRPLKCCFACCRTAISRLDPTSIETASSTTSTLPRDGITSFRGEVAAAVPDELHPVSASSSGECRCESRPRRVYERKHSAARLLTIFKGFRAHETPDPAGTIRPRTAADDTAPEGYENGHLDDHATATWR